MRLLIYLVVGAAVTLLLIWTIRRLRRPQEELPQREIIPFAPSARGWRTWLAEARALAQEQDWRNAIHLAYWAGISYLEEHGAWKPNRARTPREYLRLIGNAGGPISGAGGTHAQAGSGVVWLRHAPPKRISRKRWASLRNWGADEDRNERPPAADLGRRVHAACDCRPGVSLTG